MTVFLIPQSISNETVQHAKAIWDGAESGAVVGIIYGVLLHGGQHIVNAVGECSRAVTLSRGIAAILDDELSARFVNMGGNS